MEYNKILETERLYNGLKEANYWMYINKHTGELTFRNEETPSSSTIGFFVEDDSRLPETCRIAHSKIRRDR